MKREEDVLTGKAEITRGDASGLRSWLELEGIESCTITSASSGIGSFTREFYF